MLLSTRTCRLVLSGRHRATKFLGHGHRHIDITRITSVSAVSAVPAVSVRALSILPNKLLRHRQSDITSVSAVSVRALSILPFKLADIGEGIAEVELMKWFVKEGDVIRAFDRVCEVQSDKATVEITSRYDGTVHKVHHLEGDIVKVGGVFVCGHPILHTIHTLHTHPTLHPSVCRWAARWWI
jgi:hypothetical protein